MIKAEGRRLIIPEEEKLLGIRADNQAERRVFALPCRWPDGAGGETDLTDKECRLWYVLESGRGDSGIIRRESNGREMRIIWEIDDAVTSESGQVLVHLQFFGEGFNLQTEEAAFLVSRVCTDYEGIAESYPSELHSWEQRMALTAQQAQNAMEEAENSAASAAAAGENAEAAAIKAESWAVGGTGTRSGEETNNAKYYAEQAAAYGAQTANGQINADWDEDDPESRAYIANKPDLTVKADLVNGKVPASQLPEAAENELVVTIDWDSGYTTRTADRSWAEITAAADAGKKIIAVDGSDRFYFVCYLPRINTDEGLYAVFISASADSDNMRPEDDRPGMHFLMLADDGVFYDYTVYPLNRKGDTMTGSLTAASDSAPSTPKVRNTALVSAETTPGANGTICWTYE